MVAAIVRPRTLGALDEVVEGEDGSEKKDTPEPRKQRLSLVRDGLRDGEEEPASDEVGRVGIEPTTKRLRVFCYYCRGIAACL